MHEWDYSKGLHDLGNGIYAYLQPDGSWGLSNAGLIVDGRESILVDTLMDLARTRRMLKAMAAAAEAAGSIDRLIITHANPDHYNGNMLVREAEIISTVACAEDMRRIPPGSIAESIRDIPGKEDHKTYLEHCFGRFDLSGIETVFPTRTFEGELTIRTARKEVRIIEVGPAHTRGDLIVHVPGDGVVFGGDILFIGGTPLVWSGPVSNWIRACELMLRMDAEVFVPGHGPVTDRKGVEAVKGYLEFIREEAGRCFWAGLDVRQAMERIDLGGYASWTDRERTAVNIHMLFKEFSRDDSPDSILDMFDLMAELGPESGKTGPQGAVKGRAEG